MRKNTVLALSIAVFLLISLPLLPKTSAQTTATPTSTNSFSPGTWTDFSWRPTDTIQKKGPLENYVENQAENIRIENYPTYVEVLRDENFANDNYSYVIENVPDDWIKSENSTFVEYRPPGKSVWVWDMNVIQENVLGRFRKSGPASVYKIQFTVKPNDVTRAVEDAYENLDASIFNSDYYYKRREADLTDVSALENELEEIPVHASVGSFGNAVTRPITPPTWINDGASNKITLTINLNKRNPGYAYASGKLGSHSISWTVSSQTDWENNTSENIGTEMVSSPGYLKLMGGKYWDNFLENNLGDTLYENNDATVDNWTYDSANDKYTCGATDTGFSDDILTPTAYDTENQAHFWVRLKGGYIGVLKQVSNGDDIRFLIRVPDDIIRIAEEIGGTIDTSVDSDNITLNNTTWYWLHGWWTGDNAHLEIYENGTESTFGDLAAHIEMGGIDVTGDGIWGIDAHSASGVEGEADAWGIQKGAWTSQVWDSGASSPQQIENIEYGAILDDSTENIWWNVEATDTGENTGWFKDPNNDNLINRSELPSYAEGENYQLSLKLETDNTTHSPSVQDYTLNVYNPPPVVRSISVDNTLIDRDIDNSGGNAVETTRITGRVRDNNGRGQLAVENALFTIKDNNGTELVSKAQAESYENVDENTKDFKLVFNPSDDLPDDNLGSFDVDVDVNDTAGATDNVTSSGLFTVGDWTTTWDNTLPQHLRDITISGTADNLGGFDESLSSVTVEDESEGSKAASISGSDWDVTFSELGATEGTTVNENVLLSSDNIDGKITDSYTVQNTPPGAPENLTMPDYDNRKPNFLFDHLDNDANDMENLEIEVGTTEGDNDVWDSGAINLSTDNYIKHLPALSDNTTYYYRIRTADEEDWGPWSDNDFYLDIRLVPSINAPSDGEDVNVNYEYDLKSSAEYSGLENLTYEWDFDDGTTGTGPNPTHAWGSTGDYTITLTVSEENTVSVSDSITINVVSGGGGGGGGAAASGATWENPKAQEPGLAGIPKGLLLYPIFTIAGFTFQLWMGFGLLIGVAWAKDKKKLAGALFLLLLFLAINYGKFLMVAGS